MFFRSGSAGLCELVRVIRSSKWRKNIRYTRRSVDTISLLHMSIKITFINIILILAVNYNRKISCFKACTTNKTAVNVFFAKKLF